MKYALAIALTVFASGCLVETVSTTATTAETAVQAVDAGRAAQGVAVGTVGLAELEQAISAYEADTGSPPASLQALVPDYLAGVPRKADGSQYTYDPETGAVM